MSVTICMLGIQDRDFFFARLRRLLIAAIGLGGVCIILLEQRTGQPQILDDDMLQIPYINHFWSPAPPCYMCT